MQKKELILQQMTVGYGSGAKEVKVIHNIDDHICSGELVCLLGKNGAGKSTLMRSIMGLQPALSGSVRFGEASIDEIGPKALARLVALVLTDRVEISSMTVYELVASGRIPYTGFSGMLSDEDKRIVEKSIQTIGITDLSQKSVLELSDGERQKVMIAKALAQETPIIMLDEPTAHLDLINKLKLMKLLRDLAHHENKAILISTHDLDLALQSADRIWLIQNDKKLHAGVPEELVLSGAFEKAFAEADIAFDYTKGTFVFQDKKGRSFQVKGDDAHAFWTRKALSRNGFDIDHTSQDLISYSHQEKCWILESSNASERFESLQKLIGHLKAKS